MTPTQQHPLPESKPDFMNFDASQLQLPQQQQQQQTEHVGLAMIPENDFSKLNLNGFQNSMNFQNFHRVNAYAVTEVPKGPDPVDLLIESPVRLPNCSTVPTTANCSATSTLDSAICDSDLTVLLAKLDGAARNIKCLSHPA